MFHKYNVVLELQEKKRLKNIYMNRLKITIVFMFLCFSYSAAQGVVGIKTNLLYGGLTFTPNLGVEIGLGKRTTLDVSAGYNPWNLGGCTNDNKKLVHFIIQPEFRYFLCDRFNGHFFGIHAIYSMYNIGGHELPLLFGSGSKKYRYQGNAYGGGISYGYQLMLGTHWNLEFQAGVGYARLIHDKYNARKCGELQPSSNRNYFGLTKLGITLIYIIK